MTTAPESMCAVTLVKRPSGRPTPDCFAIDERPLPELGPGQLLVRNSYMSVDPSMRGRMLEGEMHYTTNFVVGEPLDGSAIGRVVRSTAVSIPEGAFVRHRLGWRDYAVIDEAAAYLVDPQVSPLPNWLGVLGQTGFTAYVGIVRTGAVQPKETVFVSAAAGAVGSAAGQFARLLGAETVIGSAGGEHKRRLLVDELGFDAALDYRAEPIAEGLQRVAPDGIDVYFDNVGGDHLVAALHALRLQGRVALCGMISQLDDPDASPTIAHLMQVILKRLTIRGFIVRDHEDLRPDFEKRVSGWLRTGELVSKQTVTEGLDSAADAFLGLLAGDNVGKMLVRLSDDE